MSETATPEAQTLSGKYETIIQEAITAVHTRAFYSRYPEPPSRKIYGEEAAPEGMKAFQEHLNNNYEGLLQDHAEYRLAAEASPYTLDPLGISYPVQTDIQAYIDRSGAAFQEWKKVDVHTRAGLLVESLERIKARFFELANATQHTTGQSFVMSFQASGPHSNDRALETIALGVHEQTRFPETVEWVKPMGKFDVKLHKKYKNVPLGINLLIGCSTFPIWNTTPGLYAALITGNTAIIKPHPRVIYPIAIVVEEIQKTLKDHGYDPHTVQLAVDTPEAQITKELAEHKDVKLIDYTGGNAFGDYIESLPGKRTFTEKAGVNSVVIDSTADLKAMVQNLSFSFALYSGQMCTAPQNIFIPKDGIQAGEEHLSYDDVVKHLTDAITGLVNHPKMGAGTLGAIQNPATADRVQEAQNLGLKVLLAPQTIENPEFPKARMATPTVLEVPADNHEILSTEMFGPIVFVVPVDSTGHGVELARDLALNHGAITFAAYTTSSEKMETIADTMADSFTSISFNFVGPIWINQSSGFSDFHVTGGNPAGNASLSDPEFVLNRFEIVGIRIHA